MNTVLPKPSGFDSDPGNSYVARLNASSSVNKETGPSLVLKVMAGDGVQLNTYAYYNTTTQAPESGVNLLTDVLTALSSSVMSTSGGNLTAVSSGLSPGVTQFLNNDRSYDNTRPKAYLNWILFDDQMNYVASNSGVAQVESGSSKQALVAPLQTISKNGYLYVYVSNESPQDVYFDDITVKHYSGPLLQEQSYYPFGVEMAAISDKAMNKLASQYKFNGGVEMEESIALYSTFYRGYDQQLGRFQGVDILSEKSYGMSTYGFAANSPIFFNDPLGDHYQYIDNNGNAWHHADPLAGTAMAGQQWEDGFGFDGFGGASSAGGGGGGGNPWQKILDAMNALSAQGYEVTGFSFRPRNGQSGVMLHYNNGAEDANEFMLGTAFVGVPQDELFPNDLSGFIQNAIYRRHEEHKQERNEVTEGLTGFGSVMATSVAAAETLVKAAERGKNAIELAKVTARTFSRVTKGFAGADIVNSYIKYKNKQISATHMAINWIADGFTFIGFPEVTLAWGVIDMVVEATGTEW